MKPLTTIILLSITATINCQVFFTIEPFTFKPGILYHKEINQLGVYGLAQMGEIEQYNFYSRTYKAGAGISFKYDKANILVGINRNHYFDTRNESLNVDLSRVKKISFDLGLIVKPGRLAFCAITDPLNWETSLGLGYNF